MHRPSGMLRLLSRSPFLRATVILALANGLANVFNYLYQVLMARLLDPADFGLLASLFSVFVVLSVLAPALQLAGARFAATSGPEQVRALWVRLLRRSLVLGLAATVLALALSPALSWFLHIDSVGLLLLLSVSFFFSLMLPVNMGVLQGLHRFLALAAANLATPLIRLALGAALVILGLGVFGAFVPLLVGFVLVFAATSLPLRRLPRGEAELEATGLVRYISWTAVAYGAFIVLSNIDVVLAKHYLEPRAAGEYAALAVLGRIVLFAPVGVTLVMFPMTARAEQAPGRRLAILAASIAYTLAITGAVLAVYAILPMTVVNVAVGDEYGAITPALLRYGSGMLGLAVTFLMMHYFLAIDRTNVAIPVIAGVVVQIALTVAFHSGVDQLADIRLASGLFSVVAMIFYGAVVGLRSSTRSAPQRV